MAEQPTRPESHLCWPKAPRGHWLTIIWDEVHGRFEPVELRIAATKDKTVTAQLLREIPFGTIVEEERKKQKELTKRALDRHPRIVGPIRDDALRPFGNDLEVVADVYRDAHLRGLSTTRAVADALNVSMSTAKKKVIAARKAGHLAPARPGKAGER